MKLLRQVWIMLATLIVAFVVSWVVYMPNADQRGVWRSATGGQIITLNRFQAKLYSETAQSCTAHLSFPAHLKLVELGAGATLETRGAALWLHVDGTLDPTRFDRVAALPDTCGPADPDASPRAVFDAAWAALDDHYAFFDLHGVEWDARRALAPNPDAQMDDETLVALLANMVAGLDDGHIQLGTPEGYFSPAQRPDWLPSDGSLTRADLWQIARDTVGTDLIPVDNTAIEYTLLPDGIGYVMIRHMNLNTPIGAQELPATARAFDQVASALENATAIIIDIRYNPGGSDSVAFGVASHFTATPVDVFTKTTRLRDTQTAPFTATLPAFDDTPLSQPVILLTSKLTGSAAEILTLSMRDLANVTTMGEATSGGLSDILEFTLPNGWSLGLSHQTYRTMSGDLFEGIGIPVAVPFTLDTAPFLQGEDPLLRAAFVAAGAQ